MSKDNTPAVRPEVEEIETYNPALHSWDDLATGADSVVGADLVSGDNWELFDALAGVPFLITRVFYRPSGFGTTSEGNYVSVEAVIAPEAVLIKRRINLDTLPFEPGSQIVFNDGSTGIARQITEYLSVTDRIVLPEPIVKGGKRGESSYDLPVSKWTDTRVGDMRFTPSGEAVYVCDVRLSCPRGIRISDGYENDFTKDGKTRYLA